ncbi:MAG: hypothetical protein Q4C87_01700 [Actinomycetaceae bacterium]|nr:hypothetical protein [Actinomycetaceae bacterium]
MNPSFGLTSIHFEEGVSYGISDQAVIAVDTDSWAPVPYSAIIG